MRGATPHGKVGTEVPTPTRIMVARVRYLVHSGQAMTGLSITSDKYASCPT